MEKVNETLSFYLLPLLDFIHTRVSVISKVKHWSRNSRLWLVPGGGFLMGSQDHPRTAAVTYDGATAFMLCLFPKPQPRPYFDPLGRSTLLPKHLKHSSKHIPENKNAKSNSHLLGPKLTWAGDVIQDFSFSRVCSTTVQPRTMYHSVWDLGKSLDIKAVLLLWWHSNRAEQGTVDSVIQRSDVKQPWKSETHSWVSEVISLKPQI